MHSDKQLQAKGILCVIGGIMIHLTLGTFYTFGNALPYLSSYIASKNGGESEYDKYSSQCVWIYTTMGMAQALALPLGSKMEHFLGPTRTTLIGCFIMCCGVFFTYFTCFNLYYSIITYGFIQGFGIGFSYSTPLVVGMRWFKNNKGAVNGCIIMGFGAASTIFDIIQTQLINPHNIKQDKNYAFTNSPCVLNNVPICFVKLSVIYIGMQFIGAMMLSNPPDFVCSDGNKYKELNTTVNNDNDIEIMKENLTEKQVLKDCTFWVLWFTFCLNGLCLTFFSTEWKDFSNAQLGISNDRFLSIMGSISSVFNGCGRLFWSSWMDRNKSYKLTMGLMTLFATIFLATWPLLKFLRYIHPILIPICATIWLCGLFFSICGSFSVFPTEITNIFGSNNNGVVYGLLFTSMLPSSLIGTFGIIYIQKYFGRYLTSWTFSFCAAIAFILTMRRTTKS